jgi:hypothetical protein
MKAREPIEEIERKLRALGCPVEIVDRHVERLRRLRRVRRRRLVEVRVGRGFRYRSFDFAADPRANRPLPPPQRSLPEPYSWSGPPPPYPRPGTSAVGSAGVLKPLHKSSPMAGNFPNDGPN